MYRGRPSSDGPPRRSACRSCGDVTTVTEEIGNGAATAVRFRLSYVTVLDVGAFGTVRRAVLLDDRGRPVRTVAVKRIRSSSYGGRHELDVHKRLRHPNIVRLLFYFYSANFRRQTFCFFSFYSTFKSKSILYKQRNKTNDQ